MTQRHDRDLATVMRLSEMRRRLRAEGEKGTWFTEIEALLTEHGINPSNTRFGTKIRRLARKLRKQGLA